MITLTGYIGEKEPVSYSNSFAAEYRGKSTDTKPTTGVCNGSEFLEMDTGDKYYFDGDASDWIKPEAAAQDDS